MADGRDAGGGDRADGHRRVERDRRRRTRGLPAKPFLDLLDEFGSEWEWEDYIDRKPVSSLTPTPTSAAS